MEVFKPIQVPYVIALYAVSGVCGPILGPVCLVQLTAPLISYSANLDLLDPRDSGGVCIMHLCYRLAVADDLYRERWDTWAATLWLLAGITALTTVFIFFLLPETLYSNILYRRAKRRRAQTGNPAYRSQAEIDTPKMNLATRIGKQTVDDFKLSCMDPVILFVNMHTMLIYGVLYLWFEFFPYGEYILAIYMNRLRTNGIFIVFDGIYHFTAIQQGRKYKNRPPETWPTHLIPLLI